MPDLSSIKLLPFDEAVATADRDAFLARWRALPKAGGSREGMVGRFRHAAPEAATRHGREVYGLALRDGAGRPVELSPNAWATPAP